MSMPWKRAIDSLRSYSVLTFCTPDNPTEYRFGDGPLKSVIRRFRILRICVFFFRVLTRSSEVSFCGDNSRFCDFIFLRPSRETWHRRQKKKTSAFGKKKKERERDPGKTRRDEISPDIILSSSGRRFCAERSERTPRTGCRVNARQCRSCARFTSSPERRDRKSSDNWTATVVSRRADFSADGRHPENRDPRNEINALVIRPIVFFTVPGKEKRNLVSLSVWLRKRYLSSWKEHRLASIVICRRVKICTIRFRIAPEVFTPPHRTKRAQNTAMGMYYCNCFWLKIYSRPGVGGLKPVENLKNHAVVSVISTTCNVDEIFATTRGNRFAAIQKIKMFIAINMCSCFRQLFVRGFRLMCMVFDLLCGSSIVFAPSGKSSRYVNVTKKNKYERALTLVMVIGPYFVVHCPSIVPNRVTLLIITGVIMIYIYCKRNRISVYG